jgi:hypothetical protein
VSVHTPARFRPPRVEATAELRWLLARAFGPPDLVAPSTDAVVALALSLDLAVRVGARVQPARLRAELGEPSAARLICTSGVAALAGDRLVATARDVAVVAAAQGIPVVFLKGVALLLLRITVPGARGMSDLDVLVPRPLAWTLHGALVGAGFSPASEESAGDHELPKLRSTGGECVEVHVALPGLAAGWSEHDGLAAAGRLQALPDWPGQASVPEPAVLAAHLLVHGLVQHGATPWVYPLLRMIGDLADLGLAGPGGNELEQRILPMVAGEVGAAELRVVRELVTSLVGGGWPEGRALALLEHCVAGALDADYQQALRLSLVGSIGPRAWLREVWRTSLLSEERAAAVYGPGHSRAGLLALRILRPLDLVRRAGKSLAARARLRRRLRA